MSNLRSFIHVEQTDGPSYRWETVENPPFVPEVGDSWTFQGTSVTIKITERQFERNGDCLTICLYGEST